MVKMMPKSAVHFFSQKYIAGETLQSAVDLVKDLNSKGIYATLDLLGEAVDNKDKAVAAFNKTMKNFDAL
jgi:proline dehydrogenase